MTMRPCKIKGVVAAVAVSLFSAIAALAAEPFRQLDGGEIRARLTGMEFTDGVHWAFVFGQGGHLSSISMGRRGSGHWWVREDRLCLRPPESLLSRCYEVWQSGAGVQLREPGIEVYDEGFLQKPQTPQ
jgi:hypothetical protein